MHALAIDPSTALGTLFSVLVALAVAGVMLALATDDREPSIVLAWLLVILLVPVLGLVAYFFVGRNHRRASKRRDRLRAEWQGTERRLLEPVETSHRGFSEATMAGLRGTVGERLLTTGLNEGGSLPLPADDLRVYTRGADKFRDLLADLRGATEYVHLMYLIWEQDELTAEVSGILEERLAAGVKVHILYDWLTCLPYRKTELKRLAAAGAQVAPCYKRLSEANYRNHMKMAIIDGDVVYSGGMNMGQEYIDGGRRFATWRDTHFRMTGAVVTPYLWLFALTWRLTGRPEDVFSAFVRSRPVGRSSRQIPVQVLHSSVSTDFAAIRDVFIAALLNARERVWIQSPYFVPDEPLLTAMCVAASGGVDVRFMMTGVPDKKVPYYAAETYFPQILRSGVKVYRYGAGFLHAKTVTVDDQVTIMGTCNWDIRSVILHDEVVSVVFDPDTATAAARQFETDLAECRQVTTGDLETRHVRRVRNSLYRLSSRLL